MNKLFLKSLNKLKLLEKLNLKTKIHLNGKPFLIPLKGKIGYSNIFITEPWMIDLLKAILPLKSGIFLDVGVNIGQTLLKLRSVDSELQYVGFEPNPYCVYYSSKLIELNQMRNVHLLPFGVSNETEVGVLNFFHEGSTDSSASIISNFRPDQNVVRKEFVPLYNFSDFEKIIDLSAVGFLKIDVEGAELEVLESFRDVLLNNKPIILMEILPVYNKENIQRLNRQERIQGLLSDCNYTIFRVKKDLEKVKSLERIDSIEIHSDIDYCEYVCVHDSNVESVINIQF